MPPPAAVVLILAFVQVAEQFAVVQAHSGMDKSGVVQMFRAEHIDICLNERQLIANKLSYDKAVSLANLAIRPVDLEKFPRVLWVTKTAIDIHFERRQQIWPRLSNYDGLSTSEDQLAPLGLN